MLIISSFQFVGSFAFMRFIRIKKQVCFPVLEGVVLLTGRRYEYGTVFVRLQIEVDNDHFTLGQIGGDCGNQSAVEGYDYFGFHQSFYCKGGSLPLRIA
jgi:hypothetical protein